MARDFQIRKLTDSANDGANDSIDGVITKGATVRTIAAQCPNTGEGPLRAVLWVGTYNGGATPDDLVSLAQGWIRGPSQSPTGYGDLSWHGEIETPDGRDALEYQLYLSVRNDSGAAVTYHLRWTEER